MDIAIIGAGPVGCYAGYLLAKSGHNVSIYEEHKEIGKPIQCTGILTSEFDQLGFPRDSFNSFLENTINRIEICSPNQKVEVRQKEYIVCRSKFDKFFAGLARKAGAKIFLAHSFVRREGRELVIKDRTGKVNKKIDKRIRPNLIIAADGPLSKTANAFGFYHHGRKNFLGIQAVVKGCFEKDKYSTYFGRQLCPGMWAWIVPESSTTARVGLFSLKDPRAFFNRWLEINHFKPEVMQAGLVPVYHPKQRLRKSNCYVLGDAAGFVKASTFGGIIPGLKQAKILADCISRSANDYKTINSNYQREIRSLRGQLWVHLQIRKVLSRFSDADWNRLLLYISQRRIKKVLETYTRDNPFPLVASILLKEPRFLYFLKYLV